MAALRRYQVTGVDRKTRQDVRGIFEAATAANAKAKAELQDVVVTDVRHIVPPKRKRKKSPPTEAAQPGWQWSEMSGRARCLLIASIILGTGGVVGIMALANAAGEDSILGRGLVGLLLIPFGIAGAMARKD